LETFMAKTLASIQRQIDKLQKEASAIRDKEVVGVIERIQSAIAFYGLTVDDLFGTKPAAKTRGRRKAVASPAVKTAKPKSERVIKYRDEAGNSWTGHGKRPGGFKAALEGGKTAEDLLAKG